MKRSKTPSRRRAPKRPSRKLLFIVDPWETLDHPRDTSLRLAQAALAYGCTVHWSDLHGISFDEGRVQILARRLTRVDPHRSADSFHFESLKSFRPSEFDQIHYRVDPPVDSHYSSPLWILRLDSELPEVVNPIPTLLLESEKLAALRISELSTSTLVTSDPQAMLRSARTGDRTVLKPLHLAQSKGVERLTPTNEHTWAPKVQAATQNHTTPALLQTYLPEIQEGEIRLWLVDGELIGALKKHPLKGDFRVQIDRGSEIRAYTLSRAEEKFLPPIQRLLHSLSIRLAAVDLVAGKIIDFNFTSPGLLVQLEAVHGKDLATRIIEKLCLPPNEVSAARSPKRSPKTRRPTSARAKRR